MIATADDNARSIVELGYYRVHERKMPVEAFKRRPA